jgi:hypothetical protein
MNVVFSTTLSTMQPTDIGLSSSSQMEDAMKLRNYPCQRAWDYDLISAGRNVLPLRPLLPLNSCVSLPDPLSSLSLNSSCDNARCRGPREVSACPARA